MSSMEVLHHLFFSSMWPPYTSLSVPTSTFSGGRASDSQTSPKRFSAAAVSASPNLTSTECLGSSLAQKAPDPTQTLADSQLERYVQGSTPHARAEGVSRS